ncbi:MAG: hypothetical protein ABEH61_01905 [Haloarculaceae archaeon]
MDYEQLREYWVIWYFGLAAVLFGASVLFWKPDTRGIAALSFLFGLCLILGFLGVLLEPSPS